MLAAAANRPATHVAPAIPQPSVNPSRFIEPTAGFRRDHPNFSAPSQALHVMTGREWQLQGLVELRLVENAELDGIHLEPLRHLVHRRFGGEEPGDGARP